MLGSTIAFYRKKLGITQEQLAQRLDVTNQAVSKWETDQCCPDTLLLPKIAEVFGITIDELFGREGKQAAPELPWEDDDAFHVVLYHGHTLIGAKPDRGDLTFEYEGPAKDVYCALNLTCGDVGGNVTAGGYVECDEVGGNLQAGGFVECGSVDGNLNSGSYVECGDVAGSVNAMSYVECGGVGGNVTAEGYVECGDVGGSVHGSENGGSGFHFSFEGFNPFGKK